MFFAKLFGIRVEKFYIFFDVGIGKWTGSLFHFKPKNSDTEYGMGWLPFGGYCKIAGMIDESFDTEQMAKPAEPWEFRTKPAWQRLLVRIGESLLTSFLHSSSIQCSCLFGAILTSKTERHEARNAVLIKRQNAMVQRP